MSEAAMPPLEMILRQCASAAPQPWYPRQYAQQTGVSRDSLDPHLERLRLGGFVQLTDWTKDFGQGYLLTPLGKDLLDRPRLLEGVRQGNLPEGRPPEPDPVVQPEVEIQGDRVREMAVSPVPFAPRVTLALIWVNIAWFGVGLTIAQRAGIEMGDYFGMRAPVSIILQQGALRGDLVYDDHQWWRMLTCAFVHIGLFHLVANMFSLWMIGPLLERVLGPGRYLLFYLLSALGGSIGVLVQAPGNPTAGASGAIWGLMTGLAIFVFMHRRSLPPDVFQSWFRQLIGVILISIFITMQNQRISKGGHYGGGIAGALLIMPVDSLRLRRGARAILAAVVILVMTGAGFRYAYQSLEEAIGARDGDLFQRRSMGEANQFNDTFLKQLWEQDAQSAKLTHESLSELRAFENRDPEDVKKLRKRIEQQVASTNQLKDEMTKVKFRSEVVEEARVAAIDILSANVALLTRIDECLQNLNPCNLEKEEDALRKAHATWKNLRGLR